MYPAAPSRRCINNVKFVVVVAFEHSGKFYFHFRYGVGSACCVGGGAIGPTSEEVAVSCFESVGKGDGVAKGNGFGFNDFFAIVEEDIEFCRSRNNFYGYVVNSNFAVFSKGNCYDVVAFFFEYASIYCFAFVDGVGNFYAFGSGSGVGYGAAFFENEECIFSNEVFCFDCGEYVGGSCGL